MDLESVDSILTTTRSVRKRLDFQRPVEREVIEQCLEIALQAPTGSNQQGWQFVVITDPELRFGIAELYRKSFSGYIGAKRRANPDAPVSKIEESSTYLAEHFHEAPVHVLFCYEGRVEEKGAAMQAGLYGSIIPAAWSFMLAARARGLGAAWTTLHLRYEKEAAELLGLPPTLTQAALLPVAYFTGDTFQPAKRAPLSEVVSWNRWGQHEPS